METDLLQQNGSGATIFQLKKRKIKKYENVSVFSCRRHEGEILLNLLFSPSVL